MAKVYMGFPLHIVSRMIFLLLLVGQLHNINGNYFYNPKMFFQMVMYIIAKYIIICS